MLLQQALTAICMIQNNLDELNRDVETTLRDALRKQSTLAKQKKPHRLATMLELFPGLRGHRDAELSFVYHEFQLAPASDRLAVRTQLLDDHPSLAKDLLRQFEFAELLDVYAPATKRLTTTGSQSGSSETDEDGLDETLDEGLEVGFPEHLGRFTIRKVVGQGGMGMVFEAFDMVLQRTVAIKVPRTEVHAIESLDRQLLREARIAAGLRHENLAEIYEVCSFSTGHALISRWAGGGSLYEHLVSKCGPTDFDPALWLMIEIAAGLSHCHANKITHLDLKPGNILFDTENNAADCHGFPGTPLITDFGLARVMDASRTAAYSHSVVGTPLYMAPEQIDGDNGRIGTASDVFACGVLFHELLVGRHPLADRSMVNALKVLHEGPFPALPHEIPVTRDVRRVLRKCLRTDPKHRYVDASEFHADLIRLKQGASVAASWESPWSRLQAWCYRIDSINQAAYLSLLMNINLAFGFGLMYVLVLFEVADAFSGSAFELGVDAMKLICFPHGPMAIISLLVLRGKVWLHPVNTFIATIFVGIVFVSLLTGASPFRIYEGHPFALIVIHIVILCLALAMSLSHLVALPAWWRIRRRG